MTKEKQHSPDAHESHLWVKDMKEDDHVQGLYLAKVKRVGLTKKASPFLSITLSDRTGDVEARVWENADALSCLFSEGDVLEVDGYANSYQKRIQVTISGLKVSGDGWDPALFLESTTWDTAEMMRSLSRILKGIKDTHLKALVDRFLADRRFVSLFKKAPAAKNFHHNYIGGLLEHTLSVCQMTCFVTEHYPELDRDLLITGAFLHDIGKIREFSSHTRIDYTDEGRLLGHLILGVSILDEKLGSLKKFPHETALRLKHLILSHHGQYEFGSPKRPKFLEAFALHYIDDMDAKMNGLGRFMERDRQEGAWTDFNRMFERYFLKSNTPAAGEEEDPGPPVDDSQGLLFTK